MSEEKFCSGCPQKHDCSKIYQQLGESKGPSIVGKVIVAFLLPIIVLILALALFDKILSQAVQNPNARTALSFGLAGLVAFCYIIIVRLVNKRLGRTS